MRTYKRFGAVLAPIIAGHHGGLADADGLKRRLASELPDCAGWPAFTGALPAEREMAQAKAKAKGAGPGSAPRPVAAAERVVGGNPRPRR